MRIELLPKSIRFIDYPFKSGALQASGQVHAQEILEVLPDRHPVECVTQNQEVLFVEVHYRDELSKWAQQHKVRVSDRADTWAWINEPFLDTVFAPEARAQTLTLLEQAGFTAHEVQGIREKVQAHMLMYNAVLWDWQHLGHYDVLMSRKKFSLQRLTPSFYQWTMGIALRNIK